MHWYVVPCFPPCVIWKQHRWTCNVIEFGNLCFPSSNDVITLQKLPKIFYRAKGKGAADHSLVNRWLKEFYLTCKNLGNPRKSGRHKTVDCPAVLQAVVVGSVYHSLEVCHFHELGKLISVAKILQNFRPTPVLNDLILVWYKTSRARLTIMIILTRTHTNIHTYIYT